MSSKSNKYRNPEELKLIGSNHNARRFACLEAKVVSRGRGNQGGLAKTTIKYHTLPEHDDWNAAVVARKRAKYAHKLHKKYGA